MAVTDHGIATDPIRGDLGDALTAADLPARDVSDLKKVGEEAAGSPGPPQVGDKVVAVVEYRDGTLIDVVRQVSG